MNVSTDLFGVINFEEHDIINFSEGLYGFEEAKRFLLLDIPETAYKSLQSLDFEDVAFTVTTPFAFFENYDFEVSEHIVEQLNISEMNEIEIYSMIVLRDPLKASTLNLKAPIIINIEKRVGKQVILNEDYPMRFEFLHNVEA